MTDSIPSDARRFRMAIVPVFIFIFFGSLAVLCAIVIPVVLNQYGFNGNWLLIIKVSRIVVPAMVLLAFVFSWMLHLAFPSYISSRGVDSYPFSGKRRLLAWTDIARVNRFRLGNLTFLRLYPKGKGPVIWLPLFQTPRPGFLDGIRKSAPPNHPILAYLG